MKLLAVIVVPVEDDRSPMFSVPLSPFTKFDVMVNSVTSKSRWLVKVPAPEIAALDDATILESVLS